LIILIRKNKNITIINYHDKLFKDDGKMGKVKKEDIMSLERMGSKSADNLINAINKSKSNSLDKLINSFGIRHVGGKSAKIIAQNFEDLDSIIKASVEDLAGIHEVGQIMAESLCEFFKNPQTKDLISKLKNAGLNMKGLQKEIVDNRFEGMTFVLTGTLPTLGRKEASDIIEKYGGKVSGSVSKKTTYVLAGEEAGSKLTKAQELGIAIISEKEFNDMVNN
jgi:DNA ligase (NAD+)